MMPHSLSTSYKHYLTVVSKTVWKCLLTSTVTGHMCSGRQFNEEGTSGEKAQWTWVDSRGMAPASIPPLVKECNYQLSRLSWQTLTYKTFWCMPVWFWLKTSGAEGESWIVFSTAVVRDHSKCVSLRIRCKREFQQVIHLWSWGWTETDAFWTLVRLQGWNYNSQNKRVSSLWL